MRIGREQLLQELEFVTPGLSPRDIIEQSSYFAFKKGRVFTFNDQVSCSNKTSLNITGAVPNKPLLEQLRKLPDDEIDVEATETALTIKGKGGREVEIRLEKEIALQIDSVEQPTKWHTLPAEFSEAIGIVVECASRDASKAIHCVHVHPEFIEACDNFQLSRYKLKTGLKEPVFIKGESIKHLPALGMTEIGQTAAWIHFRNKNDLVMACRKYNEEYPELDKLFNVKGDKLLLPKRMKEAASRAEIASSERADDNHLIVNVKEGKIRVQGIGITSKYREPMKTTYSGPPLKFLISPKILIELCTKHNECTVSKERLMVNGGPWRYVAYLAAPEEKEKSE